MTFSRREFTALGASALLSSGCENRNSKRVTAIFRYPADMMALEGRYHITHEEEGRAAIRTIRLGYPGIKISFTTTGTACAINQIAMGDSASWDCRVGQTQWMFSTVPQNRQETVLYEDAPRRSVTTLFRRNEAWQGMVDIHAVITNGGSKADPMPQKRLLFIGDSITCGANCDTARLNIATGLPTTNGRLSYGRILGDALDAQVHLVAYGGKGLVRDWQGLTSEVTAPQFFERALPDDPDSLWDHNQYIPDAIGICLGQNDFNQGIPDREGWVGAYLKFIARIRETAPKATLFVINSPMSKDDGEGTKGRALLDYLDAVVTKAGSPDVRRAAAPHVPGFSERERHPTAAQHEEIAAALLPAFKAALQ